MKKTNEQNLIKFRKYEDEAKRKDRQIEQLMDPRKVIYLHHHTITNKTITIIIILFVCLRI